jgi:hypothetical protein
MTCPRIARLLARVSLASTPKVNGRAWLGVTHIWFRIHRPGIWWG